MSFNKRFFLGLASAALLGGCSTTSPEPVWKKAIAGDGPGNTTLVNTDAITVSDLPKSASGNRPKYKVFGVEYAVLDSAVDFKEQGLASWYGKKFHGNATASGEIYDMHQLSAAHKHLPLPTFVRVSRMDNGQSIVVRVNDRGPFVGERIIDLSYAAAAKLGMLEEGTTEVAIEALSTHLPSSNSPSVQTSTTAARTIKASSNMRTVQAGAFKNAANAEARKALVSSKTNEEVSVHFDTQRQLHLVRVGPMGRAADVNAVLTSLTDEGIKAYPMAP